MEAIPGTNSTDPNRHPPSLVVATRAVPATEAILQHIVTQKRLTFWGEAAALIFDALAQNPDLVNPLTVLSGPRGLTQRGGAMRCFNGPPCRAILVPMSPGGMAWLRTAAAEIGMKPEGAAALILHNYAPSFDATLGRFPVQEGQ